MRKNKYRRSPERVNPKGDRLAGAARPAQVDKRSGGMTDGIRGADTDCMADGIRATDTDFMTNGIGYLRRELGKENMDTFAGLQQVLEFDTKEASLKAQVELENMMVRWSNITRLLCKCLNTWNTLEMG